jgi:hypothetical protein
MPRAPNDHTYLQMVGVCYIHLDAQVCQRVYSDCPLLDEGSALLLAFHSPSQEELMKWMERYNTLHNQCGSPSYYYSSTSPNSVRDVNTFIENRLLNVLPVQLSIQLHHLLKTLSVALHLLAGQCGPSESEVVIPVLFPPSSNRYQ